MANTPTSTATSLQPLTDYENIGLVNEEPKQQRQAGLPPHN